MKRMLLGLCAATALITSNANAATTIDSAINANGTQTFNFSTTGGIGSISVEGLCELSTGICDPSIYIFQNDLSGAFVAYNDDSATLDSFVSTNFAAGNYVATVGRYIFEESEARTGIADFNVGQTDFRITFSDGLAVAAAVPEPATWLMMLLGFGGIGYSLRRKKATTGLLRFA